LPVHGFGSLSCLVHLLAKRPNFPASFAMGRAAAERSGESRSGYRTQPVQPANVNPQLFGALPVSESRWKLFLTSWGAQAIIVLCVVNLRPWFPLAFSAAKQRGQYTVTSVVPFQPPVAHQPQPVNRHLSVKAAPTEQIPAVARLTVPMPERVLRDSELKAPELKIESKFPVISASPAPKVVATDTFSTGSPAAATTGLPRTTVQTGGFGDPNGLTAQGNRMAVTVPATGAFDLPGGSRHGNGSGGARLGVVLGSGFGNEVATVDSPISGAVLQSGFDSKHDGPEVPKAILTSGPASIPVQIFSKPNPEYTEEGRRLKIDGEVRLEVLFSSTGQVNVVRVLQGLGHGLDEEAVKAAQQIKFKPALHQGQPVDSTAVVRIIFQLAS